MNHHTLEHLIRWIGSNMEAPSLLLYPTPQEPEISVFALLDKIHDLTDINKEVLGDWLEEGRTAE